MPAHTGAQALLQIGIPHLQDDFCAAEKFLEKCSGGMPRYRAAVGQFGGMLKITR